MMSDPKDHDIEKQVGASDPPPVAEDEGSAVPATSFKLGDSVYARLLRLGGLLKVEQRGIERVPDDERTDTSYWNIASMWLAANMVVPSFTIGVLGNPLFQMGFVDSVLVIVFFNFLGVLTVCFFSTFGAAFGLRQMVLSRYWFGWWGVKLIALFNFLACIGWAAANIIVGAQLLNAVNPNVPGYAGILIIAFCTLLVVFFGYQVIHAYEYWSWIPTFVVFLVVIGVLARSGDFVNLPMRSGQVELGAVLSYGSTVFGFGTGYTSFAADYTVYQPSNRPRRNVFLATWLGIFPTLLFTQILGAALITATSINGGHNEYQQGYTDAGIGGLLGALLFPHVGTFGKFCVVILALSIVANNCPYLFRIPHPDGHGSMDTAGYAHFESVLENFMHFIGYWLAIYEGVAITEHFVFRRGFSGYQPEDYDSQENLPLGIAALLAFCCGVAGMVVGMSQSWYVGPIAKYVGTLPAGGDVGFELGFAFAACSYLPLRSMEIKIARR
ncbi:hypothetical protein N7468_007785 [Penicillium chermesinum]|uniref:Purine-cytosine permease n=1 Tax=Penicillium chermesinum TaxID=63820 RepID=A0A9W9NNY3_9EURO|nr:uncharacterized protein N7468_007785 [Penicillium chermesinum]KAJ5223243.1 hypothetical protein N7468_007785 [Penicillium chermesinum]